MLQNSAGELENSGKGARLQWFTFVFITQIVSDGLFDCWTCHIIFLVTLFDKQGFFPYDQIQYISSPY